jgi:hypothetical protein
VCTDGEHVGEWELSFGHDDDVFLFEACDGVL